MRGDRRVSAVKVRLGRTEGRRKRIGFAICLAGLLCVVVGFYPHKVVVIGLSADRPPIRRTIPDKQSFWLFNPLIQPVSVEVIAPGCGCNGLAYQTFMLSPLTARSVETITDASSLELGKHEDHIKIRTRTNTASEPVESKYEVHFEVIQS